MISSEGAPSVGPAAAPPLPFDWGRSNEATFKGESDKEEVATRCTNRGGGGGRRNRPSAKPARSSAVPRIKGSPSSALRKWPRHPSQNRRLVQRRQLLRLICEPHSTQKFGLYTVRAP